MEPAQKIISCAVTIFLLGCLLTGCKKFNPTETVAHEFATSAAFDNYWHAGKAELNSYNLTQSRYGEARAGKAVLIFVTEDVSKKKQVKADGLSYRHKINVMKVNFTKNFITGIYPYSMMLSVFTPVNRRVNSATLKATMSSQEWCGQVYTQVNLRGNRYAIKSHSYFEQEADQQYSVKEALLEDEVWNLIRLDHENLPVGKLNVLPGLFFTRLHHKDLKVKSAFAEKSVMDSSFVYHLVYADPKRELTIQYEKVFPFKILSWQETWEENGKTMKTSAVLDKTLYSDYWTKNKNEFQYLRDSLGLPSNY